MGIVLGLGAALSWGLADYFAAVASRSQGALRVVLGFHLAAMIPLTALVLATDGLAGVTATQVAVLVGVGAVGWVSYLAFYGALAIGPISVLSPIVSGYAAVTVLLAVVIGGNHLSGAQAAAVAITILGAMVASADVRAKLERRSALGVALALAAMALLGGFVFGVSYYRGEIGWLAPIFLARGFAAVFLLGHVLTRGARGERHRARDPAPAVADRDHRAAGGAGHRRLRVPEPRRRTCPDGDRRGCLGPVRDRPDRDGGIAVRRASDPHAVARRRARRRGGDRARSGRLRARP